ncbi:MAG TPA: hypothetical protein VFW45_06080 [Candidatus Polarisedimenticolia bacterium]|nr:hypothetical protein [Candidatus Polarisedimenticolia bacterium]
MKYTDEPMRSKERWLFCTGLVFGLALYQMVDIYWLRPYRDSALKAYAASARECAAHSEQCTMDLASCQDGQAAALQSKLSRAYQTEP